MARAALWLFGGLIALFLVAPILVVMVTSLGSSSFMAFPPRDVSLHWYAHFLGSPQWIGPTLLSLRLAASVAVSATLLGTSAAIGLARGSFRGRAALEMFLLSPMVVPVVVLALGLYFLFSGAHLLDHPLALWLGHTLLATPVALVLVRAGLRSTDRSLERAARSLGAGFWRTLRHVTLPAIRESVAAAAVFSFLVSFDEVVVAIFVGGPATTTLPKRMWESVRFETDPTLLAIATLLTLLAVAVLLLGAWLRPGRQT